jgi:hypothetical protein
MMLATSKEADLEINIQETKYVYADLLSAEFTAQSEVNSS